jgi:hypothetical protein
MTDVAALGFSVDSSPLVKASSALDGLSNSAKRAEAAANGVIEANKNAATSASSITTATSNAAAALTKEANAAQSVAQALNVTSSASNSAARALDNTSAAVIRLAANQNKLSGQTGNIAAQFQDIGVQLAGGQSPFLIALQQGTQLSAVLGTVGGGVRGVGAALAAAFGSILSPVSLATIAIIGLGGAALQYFTGVDDGSDKANAALKKHMDTIGQIAEKWGAQIPALREYYDQLKLAHDLEELGAGRKAVENSYWVEATKQLDDLQPKLLNAQSILENIGQGEVFTKTIKQFTELQAKIEDHTAKATDATNAAKTLTDVYETTGVEAFKDAATFLRSLSSELDRTTQRMEKFNDQFNKAAEIQERLQNTIQSSEFVEFGKFRSVSDFMPTGTAPTPSSRPSDLDNIRSETTERGFLVTSLKQQADYEDALTDTYIREQKELDALYAKGTTTRGFMVASAQELKKYEDELTDAYLKQEKAVDDIYKRGVTSRGFIVTNKEQMLEYEAAPEENAKRMIEGANGNADASVNKLSEAYRKLTATQQEQAQNLQLEASLIGASVAERARQTAALQAEQQLRQQHIDTLSREGQAYIANAKALADAKTQIDRQQSAYTSLQQAEGSLVDTFVSGFSTIGGSWKDTLKNMAQQFLQWIDTLAIANPIKNALTGSNLPTLADLFSGKPSVPGATTTGTMTVTAASVTVNGGLTGGVLPAATNNGIPGVLNSNAVRPDLTNSGIVNNPIATAPANDNLPATDIAAYIRQAAIQRGIDPNVALTVARSEGGLNSWNLQSQVFKNGVQEPSYGPYQLLVGGPGTGFRPGLGNQFMSQTGLDPSLAANGPRGVDFALDYASKNGWSSWYGARNSGISNWQGIGKMPGIDTTTTNSISQSLTRLDNVTTTTSTNLSTLGDSSQNLNSGFTNLFSTLGQTPSTTSSSSGGFFSWLGGLFGGGPSVGGGMAGNKIAAAPRPNIPAAPQSVSGSSQKVRVEVVNTVDKSGNLKPVIKSISQETVDERVPGHIKAYDKDHLPKRVRQISGDKWARG